MLFITQFIFARTLHILLILAAQRRPLFTRLFFKVGNSRRVYDGFDTMLCFVYDAHFAMMLAYYEPLRWRRSSLFILGLRGERLRRKINTCTPPSMLRYFISGRRPAESFVRCTFECRDDTSAAMLTKGTTAFYRIPAFPSRLIFMNSTHARP